MAAGATTTIIARFVTLLELLPMPCKGNLHTKDNLQQMLRLVADIYRIILSS